MSEINLQPAYSIPCMGRLHHHTISRVTQASGSSRERERAAVWRAEPLVWPPPKCIRRRGTASIYPSGNSARSGSPGILILWLRSCKRQNGGNRGMTVRNTSAFYAFQATGTDPTFLQRDFCTDGANRLSQFKKAKAIPVLSLSRRSSSLLVLESRRARLAWFTPNEPPDLDPRNKAARVDRANQPLSLIN